MPETAERAPDTEGAERVVEPRRLRPADVHARRRLVAGLAALGAVVVAVVAVLLLAGGGDDPPANDAAKLVPSNALVYVHLSTDPDRPGVDRALRVAGRLPSFNNARDAILRTLSTRNRPVAFARDIRPWLGNEAALAVLPGAESTSVSEIVLDVRDRDRAEKFITDAAGTGGRAKHRGVTIARYGTVATAFVSGDLIIAPESVIRGVIDRSKGRGVTLAETSLFKRAYAGLPAGRAADAYASRDGVRRLLAPQGGLLGLAATVIDQPALAGLGAALTASGDQARLSLDTVLDPTLAKANRNRLPSFDPKLLADVPTGALAYLGASRLDQTAGRLLGLAGAGGVNGAGLARLAQRARTRIARQAGVDVDRDVLPLLRRETALFVLPGIPTPTLALIASAPNEKAARETLAKLQVPLANLFAPPSTGAGQTPTFQDRVVDGVDAFQLRLAPTIELDYAVFDGKLVVATSLEGIRRVKQHDGSLENDAAFDSVLAHRPSPVTSLVFLDFGQLLALSERTGLGQDPAYLAVRDDLDRIRAVGLATTADKNESTAEITLSVK